MTQAMYYFRCIACVILYRIKLLVRGFVVYDFKKNTFVVYISRKGRGECFVFSAPLCFVDTKNLFVKIQKCA